MDKQIGENEKCTFHHTTRCDELAAMSEYKEKYPEMIRIVEARFKDRKDQDPSFRYYLVIDTSGEAIAEIKERTQIGEERLLKRVAQSAGIF